MALIRVVSFSSMERRACLEMAHLTGKPTDVKVCCFLGLAMAFMLHLVGKTSSHALCPYRGSLMGAWRRGEMA